MACSTELWFGRHSGEETASGPAADDVASRGVAVPHLVLVVDDYDDTRLLYVENLRAAGFRVIEACNGDEAFTKAVELVPDAIVMDLSMPTVDGWEATRRVRSHPLLRDVYILALSAMEGEQSRSMAFDVGCDDFASKPLLPASLAEILRGRLAARSR